MYSKLCLLGACVFLIAGCTVHREVKHEAMAPADHDRDGILDINDRCPSDPETYNGYRDGDGCPDEIPKVSFPAIHYGVNSSDVAQESKAELAAAADVLQRYPGMKIMIEGHTDSYGTASYNMDISKRRAERVKNALVKTHGISAGRISTAGHGMSRPVASFNTKEGRIANRRIEFVIVEGWPPRE